MGSRKCPRCGGVMYEKLKIREAWLDYIDICYDCHYYEVVGWEWKNTA